jgi:hypothetical protein
MRSVGGLATYFVFSVVVAAVLAAILPALLLPYVVVAVIGGFLLLRDQLRGDVPRFSEQEKERMISQYLETLGTARDDARAEAEEARKELWYVDAVVDMDDVERKWTEREGPFAGPDDIPWLRVPNPYFVLPLPKLVQWGFVSALDVREALRWANSPTPPVQWRNPPMMRVVGLMGWPEAEAWARIGLLFWSMPVKSPTPADAQVEASCRAQGQVYDVPRPASLG